MADYSLSEEADRDVLEIALYTIENWDETQADRYVLGLHSVFGRLSGDPRLGISVEHVRKGYFRYRYRSHMIFYKRTTDGIFVVRVLHGRMDYLRHL